MESSFNTMYEFIFNKKTLEYKYANTAFYSLRGENNTYAPLEYHLYGDSKETLMKAVKSEDYDSVFLIDFTDGGGKTSLMACRLLKQRSNENIGIRMIELDRLFDGYRLYQLSDKENNALLAQYVTTYYYYDCASGIAECLKYGMGKEILGSATADELCEGLCARVSDECADTVGKFVSNIKNGVRNFSFSVTARESGNIMLLTGTAIYEGDVHIKTVGRIGGPSSSSLAEFSRRDQLTGLYLKETIAEYARRRIEELQLPTTVAIIDIDDFKNVNDAFGHSKGDEVLKRCASVIAEQTGSLGKAGRIGGDEFFIVFDNNDIGKVKDTLRGIKQTVFNEYSDELDGFHVSTSMGVAVYPDDLDNDYGTVFRFADCLLYRAKHKGKNRYIVYNPEKHGTIEDVFSMGVKKAGLSGSRGMEKSELVCRIADAIISGTKYPLDNILEDITAYFGVERIVIYNKTEKALAAQYGANVLSEAVVSKTIDYIYSEWLEREYEGGVLVRNNVKYFAEKNEELYNMLTLQGISALMQFEILAPDGKTYIVSYETLSGINVWSSADMHYYRVLSSAIGRLMPRLK